MKNGFQRPKVHQNQIGLANQKKTQLIFAASSKKANRCGYGLHIALDSSKKLNSRASKRVSCTKILNFLDEIK